MDILAWVIGVLIAIILFGVVLMGIFWFIGEIIDMRDKVTHTNIVKENTNEPKI